MRAREIDHLLAHIQRSESVRVVGSTGFGRSTFLAELCAVLVTQGYTISRTLGDPATQGGRYAALRGTLLTPEQLALCANPADVHAALEKELATAPNPIVLVDDAEWLDLPSAQVISAVLRKRGIPGVFVSAPFDQLEPDQRATAHTFVADTRLDLHALNLEQVRTLTQRMLGGPVHPEVVAEVFALSSGITAVAADIVRTASAAGGLRRDPQQWVSTGDRLWNPALEELIERLLAHLDHESLALMHALGLAGSLPVRHFRGISPAAVDSLARHGLITTFLDPHRVSRVAPRPALIADYFRHRPVDLAHIAAAELLTQLGQAPAAPPAAAQLAPPQGQRPSEPLLVFPTVSHDLEDPRDVLVSTPQSQGGNAPHNPQHVDTTETHNASLARYLRDQSEQRLNLAAQAWLRSTGPAAAARYLEALLESNRYQTTAAEVLDATRPQGANPLDLLVLALHEAGVRIIHGITATRRRPHRFAEALRRDYPGYASAYDAYCAYLGFCARGRDAATERWLQDRDTDPVGMGDTVEQFIRAASDELLLLEVVSQRDYALAAQHAIAEQTRLITEAWHLSFGNAYQELTVPPIVVTLSESPAPYLASAFSRAQLLLALGYISDARTVLSQALSLGMLDLRYVSYYAASLRWLAYLHFRDGNLGMAQSLLDESKGYPASKGPLPGMRPEFAVGLELLFSGDHAAASESFLADAEALVSLGLHAAAWVMARFAFQLCPGERTLTVIHQIGRHPTFGWVKNLAAFAEAALRQDPGILHMITRLTRLSELAIASDFLEEIERAAKDTSTPADEEYADAVAVVRETFRSFQEPLGEALLRSRDEDIDALTPREREIAPLTASLSNREIAARLTLSVRTVENHIARAMKKLGVNSRIELGQAATGKPPNTTQF